MLRVLIVAALAALCLASSASGGTAAPPDQAELERQKLEQEVRKLRQENDRSDSAREALLAYAPFATVLLAVAGVVVPLMREARERRGQREAELDQRKEELEQQKQETRRRFEDQFARSIGDLGSDREAVRVSAAVSLENFLRPDYGEFHDQVYRVLCANLTVEDHGDLVNRFLVRAFARAARLHVAAAAARGDLSELDLGRCKANRVDLSKLNLAGADFAFGTFRGATLTDCDLTRATGYEAVFEKARFSRSTLNEIRFHKARLRETQFHDAVMTSAELRKAELAGAQLQRARLQGAHFDGADLSGARFDQARLADAHFRGATLDDRALSSILNADDASWRKATFDPDVRKRLEELDERRGKRDDTGTTP